MTELFGVKIIFCFGHSALLKSCGELSLVADLSGETARVLPRKTRNSLNCIQCSYSCCAYMLHIWGLKDSELFECGNVQTREHIDEKFPLLVSICAGPSYSQCRRLAGKPQHPTLTSTTPRR